MTNPKPQPPKASNPFENVKLSPTFDYTPVAGKGYELVRRCKTADGKSFDAVFMDLGPRELLIGISTKLLPETTGKDGRRLPLEDLIGGKSVTLLRPGEEVLQLLANGSTLYLHPNYHAKSFYSSNGTH